MAAHSRRASRSTCRPGSSRSSRFIVSKSGADRHEGRAPRKVLARRQRHREHVDARDRRHPQGDRRRRGGAAIPRNRVASRLPVRRRRAVDQRSIPGLGEGQAGARFARCQQAERRRQGVRAHDRGIAAIRAGARGPGECLPAAVRAHAIRQRARSRSAGARDESGARSDDARSDRWAKGGRCSGICCAPRANRKKDRPPRGARPRSSRTTGGITIDSPTARGEKNGCARSIARSSSMPGFAPARMLSCMVFVARGTMDRAEREASIGADAQRQHQDATHAAAGGWLSLAARNDPRDPRRSGRRARVLCGRDRRRQERPRLRHASLSSTRTSPPGSCTLRRTTPLRHRRRSRRSVGTSKAIVGMSAIDGTSRPPSIRRSPI